MEHMLNLVVVHVLFFFISFFSFTLWKFFFFFLACLGSCETCFGGNLNECLSCSNNKLLEFGSCLSNCSFGNYPDQNQICQGIFFQTKQNRKIKNNKAD